MLKVNFSKRAGYSLSIRLLMFVIFPVVAVAGVGTFFMLNSLEKEMERRMQKDVELIARALKLPLTHALKRGRQGSIENALASAEQLGEVYNVSLYDHKGRFVASLPFDRQDRRRSHIDEVLEDGRSRGRYGEVGGRSVYSYFVPLTDGPGQNLGLLQVSRRKRDFRRLFKKLRRRWTFMLGGGVIAIIAIVLLGYYGAVGRSLSRLRRSMERVQAGNRKHRAEKIGPKETTVVAEALNAMLDAMEVAEAQILEEQISRLNLESRLQQSKKLAAVGQLAAGVAHELGTPLSVIDGRAQRALRSPDLPQPIVKTLKATRKAVRRMEKIVQQLLNFAHPVSRERRAVAPLELIEDVLLSIRHEPEKTNITIKTEQGPAGLSVTANLDQAAQAMVNLTKNAIQAAEQIVVLSWHEHDEGVVFSVDDDGEGINPEISSHIFEPFFTTKQVGKGTGLGLSIAYSIIRNHNGWISVKRSPLGGARFEIFLPSPKEFNDRK